jgi:hypothetical protein
MLNQQTIEKLHVMKLHGMADAFHAQLETTDTGQLSSEERFALLVDQQWLWKENRALARRLRYTHLKERGWLARLFILYYYRRNTFVRTAVNSL